MKNINSAYRVRLILKKASSIRDQEKVHSVWNQALDINEDDLQKRRVLVSRCLGDLHEEVESIKSDMEGTGYSQNLYLSALNNCNSIFSVQHLESQWQGPKKNLTDNLFTVLGFCSEILPNEENEVNQQSLDELAALTLQMKEMLSVSELGAGVKRIIESQINNMDEALSKYRSVGARAFNSALQSAVGEVVLSEDVLKSASNTPEVGKLKEMYRKLSEVARSVSEVNSGVDTVVSISNKVSGIIAILDKF